MFFSLFKEFCRRGPLLGDWILLVLMVPALALLALLFFVLVYPVLMIWMTVGLLLFARQAATFSDTGITFKKAHRRRTIFWPEIREVIRQHGRGLPNRSYVLVCEPASGPRREFTVAWTQDDAAFERAIIARGLPLTVRDPDGNPAPYAELPAPSTPSRV